MDEVSERELVLVVSVSCGKERDMTRGWQLFWDTKMCILEPRVFAWWNVIILFRMCCDTLCASVHAVWVGVLFTGPPRRLSGSFSPGNRNWSLLWEKIHDSLDHEECLEFQLLVFHLFRSQFVDEDEAVGKFPRDSFWNLQPVRGSTA